MAILTVHDAIEALDNDVYDIEPMGSFVRQQIKGFLIERSARKTLPARRHSFTFSFKHVGAATQQYYATVGFYEDHQTIGELFINSSQKSGSESDINAADGAVAISLALQYGCTLETLRGAMKRNADGSASGPLGHALDILKEGGHK